jgi:predicted alpha/beta hydrolase
MEEIKIQNDRGVALAATVFHPVELKGAIMIGPATGIKRGFYHAFAQFLAEQGYGVITFDNEGIGGSKHGHIKHSTASLVTWGQSDMTAVFSTLKTTFPGVKYHLVGHSAGGQLIGMMHGATELTSMFNFACSSGSIRNMKNPFWLKAKYFMNVFIPLNNLIYGYTNAQWVGMGEPLPKHVARQWSLWCNSTGYAKKHIDEHDITHYYNELNFPSIWLHAIDDDIAISENVDDMIRVYPQLKSTKQTMVPAEFGLKEIGHMKFFSKHNKQLWQMAIDWLGRH